MAQSTQESSLDKLLKSRYPLTYYLSRQQQFAKLHSTIPALTVSTSSAVSAPVITHEQKTQLPPPVCFNVPDTLDFDTTGYEQNVEMDQDIGLEENGFREFDETLLFKDINNRMNDRNGDVVNDKNSSTI